MGRRSGWAPWRRSTAASLRAEFALLIGFLLVVGLLRFLGDVVLAGQLEERSRSVTAAAGDNHAVLQALTDAETGVRGYQLTGDATFLEPYRTGIREYPAALDRAIAEAPTAEIRQLLLAQLDGALDWLSRFGALVASGPAGQPSWQAARSAEGKALFDQLRATNAAVGTALRGYDDQLIARFRVANGISEAVLATLSILSAGLALVLGIRTSRLLLRPLDRIRAGMSVRDTGIGIPEKERSVLFEPFRRARNATANAIPGTGLGLAIVRAVVLQHHGTVALESTEGAGTVITITLPACPVDRRREPAGRHAAPA